MTGSSSCVRLLSWTGTYFYYQNKFDTTFRDRIQAAGDDPAFKGRTYVSPGTGGDRRDLRRMNPQRILSRNHILKNRSGGVERPSFPPVWMEENLCSRKESFCRMGKHGSEKRPPFLTGRTAVSSVGRRFPEIWGAVVRGKGILPCGKEWLRFDITDNRFSHNRDRALHREFCRIYRYAAEEKPDPKELSVRISSEQDCDQSDRK